jgi:hypothetical protein
MLLNGDWVFYSSVSQLFLPPKIWWEKYSFQCTKESWVNWITNINYKNGGGDGRDWHLFAFRDSNLSSPLLWVCFWDFSQYTSEWHLSLSLCFSGSLLKYHESFEERQSERVWGRRCWDFNVKDVRMRITKTWWEP